MQKKRTFAIMGILIAVLVLGVGYAAIANITLNLTGNVGIKANADFAVGYDTTHTVATNTVNSPASVAGAYTSTSAATMTVTLDNANKTAYAIYKVDNNSTELAAQLSASVTPVSGTYASYFNITAAYYSDAACNTPLTGNLAHGNSAYLKVTVTLTKAPIEDVAAQTFSVTTTAVAQEA